jgi:hypothetical protein
MLISEVINRLHEIWNTVGDVEVFMGSFYQDLPIESIIIEDGYPLIHHQDFLASQPLL